MANSNFVPLYSHFASNEWFVWLTDEYLVYCDSCVDPSSSLFDRDRAATSGGDLSYDILGYSSRLPDVSLLVDSMLMMDSFCLDDDDQLPNRCSFFVVSLLRVNIAVAAAAVADEAIVVVAVVLDVGGDDRESQLNADAGEGDDAVAVAAVVHHD